MIMADAGDSPIQQLYANKTILVTGATGFVGKCLIQRLLQTCHVKRIYILLRGKRGQSVATREQSYLNEDVFSYFEDKATYLQKLTAIEGDVSLPRLGLSDADYNMLVSSVNVVYHGAATIRFNEGLKRATMINVYGTQQIIELCRAMVNFNCLVHMSSFSAWFVKDHLEEKVYDMDLDVVKFLDTIKALNDDQVQLDELELKYIGKNPKYPNSYMFTKTLAEILINTTATDLKVAIVRLPFIGHALKYPHPGWFDKMQTIIGIFCAFTTGMVRFVPETQLKVRSQILPVDSCSNAMIAISWEVANTSNPSSGNAVKVYNAFPAYEMMSSLEMWQSIAIECVDKYPSIKQMIAPKYIKSPCSPLVYILYLQWLSMMARVGDFMLNVIGKKPYLSRFADGVIAGVHEVTGEGLHKLQITGDCNKMDVLYSKDLSPVDRELYYFDHRKKMHEVPGYITSLYMQFRRKILREPDSNIVMAKKRFDRIKMFFAFVKYSAILSMVIFTALLAIEYLDQFKLSRYFLSDLNELVNKYTLIDLNTLVSKLYTTMFEVVTERPTTSFI